MLTFGSLFAGIGGIDLGFERAGMKCKWQVEIDNYARKVLAKHWPDVPRYRDVRYFLGGKRWRRVRAAWDVDLIAGGFPCQDISNAGTRAGITGARSGLWSEFARIVRLLRPRYVFVENVPALLGRGIGRVLGDLADCGFDAEWFCLPAAALGAPYIRDRLFIVGRRSRNDANYDRIIDNEEGRGLRKEKPRRRATRTGPANLLHDVSESHGDHGRARGAGRSPCTIQRADQQAHGEAVSVSECARLSTPESKRLFRGPIAKSDWWSTEPNVVRVVSGIPFRVDRIRGLGNAVIPQIAEWIARRIIDAERSQNDGTGNFPPS